ncbi:hypothetical protein SCHPADRAFT_928119 [Schizopora paradoxa]|uniref:Uncharacterized protein n=1 Tax=Schizopora paradoxa TaxID=27342 RepID=A0A0H2RXA7_9AGAM|nr:hypothetical protein SCHPADRAFT_928119 [Schizopora paradoxa]
MPQGTRKSRSAMGPQDGNGDGALEPSSTSELEGGQIRPEALSKMMEIIEKLIGDGGRIGTSSGWFDELWGSKSNLGSQEGSLLVEGAETKIARRRQRERVWESLKGARDTANTFLEMGPIIGDHILSQIKRLEERLEAEEIADRLSLLSLPDEILVIILENTAWRAWADEEKDFPRTIDYIQTSTRLSHVCQRLRHIAISTQSLWDRTNNFIPAEMVETCFNRLTSPIAEVAMRGSNRDQRTLPPSSFVKKSYESYLTTTCPFSQHWRRYVHEDPNVYVDILKEVASLTRGLVAPHLSEMVICYDSLAMVIPIEERSREGRDALYYFSTWTIPSLSSLRISNVIPSPNSFSNSHFLTKLDASFTFNPDFNPRDFAFFLGSLSRLEELLICFECIYGTVGPTVTTETVLSSVRTLGLDFSRSAGEFVGAAFAPLRFPNVAVLKLCAWEFEEWLEEEVIDEVIRAVITDSLSFPKLAQFELGLGLTVKGQHDTNANSMYLVRPLCTVCIPFGSLVQIQHLVLVGMVCVFVDIPDMSSLPALRSLTLKDCKMLDREWVLQLLPKLFERGLEPSQLTVVNCKWSEPMEKLELTREDGSESDTGDGDYGILNYRAVTAEEMLSLACSAA